MTVVDYCRYLSVIITLPEYQVIAVEADQQFKNLN